MSSPGGQRRRPTLSSLFSPTLRGWLSSGSDLEKAVTAVGCDEVVAGGRVLSTALDQSLFLPGQTVRGPAEIPAIYVQHIRKQIHQHSSTLLNPILEALLGAKSVDDSERSRFVCVVASEILSPRDREPTLEELTTQVCRRYEITYARFSERALAMQAVFAVLGWVTMLFTSGYNINGCSGGGDHDHLRVATHAAKSFSISSSGQPIALAKRPVSVVLKKLGVSLLTVTGSGGCHGSDVLHVSQLNAWALRATGHISIVWVDCLSEHLNFDPVKRTLCLFRFPSICIKSRLDSEGSCYNRYDSSSVVRHQPRPHRSVLTSRSSRVLTDYFSEDNKGSNQDLAQAYKAEVLLSYRLIFGQTKRARNHFKAVESKAAMGDLDECDPILAELCSSSKPNPALVWPDSDGDYHPHLHRTTYHRGTDFPILGERLEAIQSCSNRQRPTRFLDMWRDKRDPLQWYTVWAVLCMAIISLLLTIVGLGINIAQLMVAMRQSSR